ncbi:phage portal protein [Micromonospora sp. WMMD980]|uniref:phage portal protein n=1 Tax=Micromonospora sp. WMMD980 TaxID=3016088 RepID=UPI0024159D9D|nr:phage portal protein [Micromonospora sp. WMMD980]MDG4799041.1 phage portal protein [Micromonospora sp. WMMD980]
MAFVVSAGQLRALEPSAPQASMWPAYASQLGGNQAMTYAAIYRSQPAVRTVVGFLARNLAQLGLHAYRRLDDNDRERLTDHPIAALLRAPNPTTTTYRLVRALVSDLAIFDDAYWVMLRAEDTTPVGVRRLPPWRVEARGADWTDAESYRLHGTHGYLDLDAANVVHFRGYNPDDSRVGSSPIEALRQVLAEEHAAARWREQMWSNGARISGYLKRPVDAPEWSDRARERFRAGWQSQYTGDGPQAGGTPVLEDGMEFVAAGVNPKEAQYVESRKLTREETAAAYHIAPPLVGILDHATFSNIREQHKQLYQDTLGPWCAEIEQEIGLQLLPFLPDSGRVYVEFNIAEKLQGSFDEQAQQLQMAVGGPYMTRNEARGLSNLSRVDGGDELIVPLNVAIGEPADVQGEQPALPAGPAGTDTTGEGPDAD